MMTVAFLNVFPNTSNHLVFIDEAWHMTGKYFTGIEPD
jgi:hypothetical protein